MKHMDIPGEIGDLLNRLGLTANYMGFFYTGYAAYLAAQSPQRLCLVTKWLYPDVARHYQTTPAAVERSIRSSISYLWNRDPSFLRRISAAPLPKKPSNAQFLAILAAYLSRGTPGG